MDDAGNFIAAWCGDGLDEDGQGVFARRYGADGVALGDPFQANTYTTGDQREPSVAIGPDGEFVVVWESRGQDGDAYAVYGQRYLADGTRDGDEFLIGAGGSDPTVAFGDTGEFLVVWDTRWSDPSGSDLFGRWYYNDGSAVDDAFLVNSITGNAQVGTRSAFDAAGNFVVTWSSNAVGSQYDVYARRFAADGSPVSEEFRVNTYTSGVQTGVDVATDDSGRFVICWYTKGRDGYGYGSMARVYNADGTPRGDEFVVNTTVWQGQGSAHPAMYGDGRFVIAWHGSGKISLPSGSDCAGQPCRCPQAGRRIQKRP